MLFKELMNNIRHNFMIDDEMRVKKLSKDSIAILEHIDEIIQDNKIIVNESDYDVCVISFKNNQVSTIDHNFTIFTPSNKESVINIVNLIGTQIEDLNDYMTILDKENYLILK